MKKPSTRSEATPKRTKGSPATVAARPAKGSARAAGTRRPESAATASPPAPREQSQWFDKGAALFHARDFKAARECFEKAASGPVLQVMHAARSYLRMCEQRIGRATPAPATAEDHYNLAIAHINLYEFAEAERHLLKALEMAPNGDHLYYAMALCRGKRGEIQQACQDLRRAIELQPRNRAQARVDPDFADLARQPLFEELLFPDKTRS